MTEILPTIFDPATCARKGLCPVTAIRNKGDPFESHSLYYEQHGTGPEKVLFIMGLNSSSFSWAPQVKHFGSLSECSALVFDNRGVGNSGVPRGPYTTSGMAEDAITLLNYVGWTETRSIHVVGGSLGGMIAQELAIRIPERIVSLTLAVTTAGGHPWSNFPPWKGLVTLARVTFIKDIAAKIPLIQDMVYPTSWLDEIAEGDPDGRTNREIEFEYTRQRIEVAKPQTLIGALSQMCAGLTHHVSPARLRQISKSIPKVLILTGDMDHLVDPNNSLHIKAHMAEAELVQWENTGHAIHAQRKQKFNLLLERVFKDGRERVQHEKLAAESSPSTRFSTF